MKCVSCDVSLTLHQSKNAYRCHMCNYMIPATSKCRLCNSSHIKHLGFGTERIEAAIRALFPEARVARMDQDTTTRKGSVVRLLKDIKDRKTDILIGTQMIAKGHDFPGITLVGIICADQSLNFPDFRACERTFQLLAQVAGRAGRGDQPGQVIMQTYNPNHFSILAAEKQDFQAFYQQEIGFRSSLGYPPFSRMVQIRISGKDRIAVKDRALALGNLIGTVIRDQQPLFDTLGVLGPIEAAIPKLADQYRWQVLLKCTEAAPLHRMARLIVRDSQTAPTKDGVRIIIDIDPYYLM
jgi:primosomal protein N' (replication factor Y)